MMTGCYRLWCTCSNTVMLLEMCYVLNIILLAKSKSLLQVKECRCHCYIEVP